MTARESAVLRLIGRQPTPVWPDAIADFLGLDLGDAIRAVVDLAARGYVERDWRGWRRTASGADALAAHEAALGQTRA